MSAETDTFGPEHDEPIEQTALTDHEMVLAIYGMVREMHEVFLALKPLVDSAGAMAGGMPGGQPPTLSPW